MLSSAVLAIAILVLASTTVSKVKTDTKAVYSGDKSTGYLNPSELVKALKGEGLPPRFDMNATTAVVASGGGAGAGAI